MSQIPSLLPYVNLVGGHAKNLKQRTPFRFPRRGHPTTARKTKKIPITRKVPKDTQKVRKRVHSFSRIHFVSPTVEGITTQQQQ